MISLSYIKDFEKSRESLIGASEISSCLPHPDKPHESLAGYGSTAVTLYQEKAGITKRDPSGRSAKMGHYLEPKILTDFIHDFADDVFPVSDVGLKTSDSFYRGYMLCELERMLRKNIDCRPFNNTDFKHHTEAKNGFGVAHADCVYVPKAETVEMEQDKNGIWKYKKHKLTFDYSKAFLIEAKSARYWVVKTRKKDRFGGYDLELKKWRGIPLKHYFQIQYQLALYDMPVGYLALGYDTSEFHYWQIKANKKHQADLLETAYYMKQCIDKKQPPKLLALNAQDIRKLYPEIQEDFRELKDAELEKAIQISKDFHRADEQETKWEQRKKDAKNAMSIILKDQRMVKGMIDGELQDIATWKKTGGGFGVMGLKDMEEADPNAYRYLKRKKLIKPKKSGETPNIKLNLEG